jgi:hypothetical protein
LALVWELWAQAFWLEELELVAEVLVADVLLVLELQQLQQQQPLLQLQLYQPQPVQQPSRQQPQQQPLLYQSGWYMEPPGYKLHLFWLEPLQADLDMPPWTAGSVLGPAPHIWWW